MPNRNGIIVPSHVAADPRIDDIRAGAFCWLRSLDVRAPHEDWQPIPEEQVPDKLKNFQTISFLQKTGYAAEIPGDHYHYRLVPIDDDMPDGPNRGGA